MAHLLEPGAPIPLVVDDILLRRRGKKVHAVGWFHDGSAAGRVKLGFDTAFSEANVEIHSVAAAVEMLDGTTALRRGAGLDLEGRLYSSRLGHYHIDLARAWLLHGDHDHAVTELQTARHLSPQQTRYHPQVHETIRALARARRRCDPVARLAAWAGVRE